MGRDHQREAQLRVECLEEVEHAGPGVGVELTGRLVAQQQLGLLRERARDCHPLRLPAGQLGRQRVELGPQPDQAEQADRIFLGPADVRGEGDVLERGERRKQVCTLEYVSDRSRAGPPAGGRVE